MLWISIVGVLIALVCRCRQLYGMYIIFLVGFSVPFNTNYNPALGRADGLT